MLVIALLIAPWLRLPIPVVAESFPLQEIEEGTTAVHSTSERVPESPLWMPEPAPAENENPSMSEISGTLSSRISIKLVAVGLYLTGVILFLLYQCIGHLLFFRKVRRWAHPVSDSDLMEQYSALTASLLPSSPAVDFAGSVFPHAGGTVASGSVAASGNRILPVGPVGAASRADPLEAS
mgnify:CR=1 FL=1